MTAWVITVFCALAAGARVGRVLVRGATPLRMALLVAVAFLTLASVVWVPPVGAALRALAPGTDLRWTLAVGATTLGVVSGTVGAVSSSSRVSRRWMRPIALAATTATVLVLAASVVSGSERPAAVVTAAAGLVIVAMTVRYVAWTPLGRGVAALTLGALVLVVAAVGVAATGADAGWPVGVAGAGAVLVATGTMWVPVELWVRARLTLRRVRGLRRDLVARFPEVSTIRPGGRTTTVLDAQDAVAQIVDALYIQAGAGLFPTGRVPLPDGTADRVAALVEWIDDPHGSAVLDTEWIAPPDGMSARRWVLTIASAYDDRHRRESTAVAVG
ncbi:hypothetical protein DW322_08280 [Rhodococcus rhodnii]|uniref:Uncharacterized protein n=2 Tax=Rhodococcus rhodnii TaxID=38312 RepID=R7WQQ1_9NOCA|nr:hypothetical protein [Rhodococcus rhodnii]EOM77610.1 hypothetical protein Rrhod_1020 [Rhodococcus rhodnii LMG 5362]TXG90220.1 hypothetical protein DW322_08280 [Rhodococcus rhodnii]